MHSPRTIFLQGVTKNQWHYIFFKLKETICKLLASQLLCSLLILTKHKTFKHFNQGKHISTNLTIASELQLCEPATL